MRVFRIALSIAASMLALASCEVAQPEIPVSPETADEEFVLDSFTTSISETKTTLTSGCSVLWNNGDKVWYFSGGNPGGAVSSLGSTAAPEDGHTVFLTLQRNPEDTWYNAIFRGGNEDAQSAPNIKFASETTIVFDGVKPEQDGTFADAHTCVSHVIVGAKSMIFHNVTAMLRFTFSRTDISRIIFRGANGEPLCGDIKLDATAYPCSASPDELTFPEVSVSLAKRASAEDTIYFSVIPQKLAKGFSVSFYDVMGVERYTASSSTPLTLKAGVITDLGALESEISPVITEQTLFTAGNWAQCTKVLEEYLDCGPKANRSFIISCADALVSQQLEDGSWPDVNYRSRDRNNWSPTTHTGYFRDIAKAWHITKDDKYLEACRKALSCWIAKRPYSDNWWYNQIGAQRVFAPAFLLLRDVLTPGELADADNILSRATMLGMTGENALWVAGIRLQRGLLKKDIGLVKEAYEIITGELRTTTAEGIQPDYSFHQHGRIMQTGVYGLSFAHDYAWWFHAFEGTSLELSGQKREVLVNFMLKSQTWLVWGGQYDLNACGRQVGQGEQYNKAATVDEILDIMGLRNNYPTGAMYYPYSDFGVYRAKSWCASVRMQSNHLQGWEYTNNEDIQGYFSSDGALLVRRDGSEYRDIGACWNWKHIPGTTTYDHGSPLWGALSLPMYNPTDLVFGKAVDDTVLVAAMDVVRDGLTGRKAWFFYPEGIVCLGAGITMNKGYEVTTTLEQSILGGVRSGENYYTHRGVTYYLLDGGPMTALRETRTGKWSDVCPSYSSDPVTTDIFELTVSHGTNPQNASYAYIVSPMGLSGSKAVEAINAAVHIESNTKDIQSVTINGRTYTINWNTATIQ